jgi:hypothetical protein
MSKGREIRCYDYVNHPYQKVRDALCHDPAAVFQAATAGAASRAESVAANLRVNIAGIEVGKEIAITVGNISEEGVTTTSPKTTIPLQWEAAESPRLFPLMKAELTIYPLTGTETQLDLDGMYDPPAGALGGVIDSVVGHRIAESTVHRFIADVAAYLRKELA